MNKLSDNIPDFLKTTPAYTPRVFVDLVEPQIPPNTGSIARSCVASHAGLVIVGKAGFQWDHSKFRRAGLDYWENLHLEIEPDVEKHFNRIQNENFYLLSTKGTRHYSEVNFQEGDRLIFGSETKGLSEDILNRYRERCITIPIDKILVRSLNLSNAVNIVLFEALRQLDFPHALK